MARTKATTRKGTKKNYPESMLQELPTEDKEDNKDDDDKDEAPVRDVVGCCPR